MSIGSSTFKIVETVSDNAINFGRVEAPLANPSNLIEAYDYSGKYLENTSTFPGRKRTIDVDYDTVNNLWYMGGIYASDLKLTNRFIVKRGINAQVPLYYSYTTRQPLKSVSASFDNSTGDILNSQSLLNEYEIVNRNGDVIPKVSYIHDIEFIPWHIKNSKEYNETFKNLFYLKIFSNGSLKTNIRKVRFKAQRTNLPSTREEAGYTENISVESIFDLFDVSFDNLKGSGLDLIGFSFPEGFPENSDTPTEVVTTVDSSLFPTDADNPTDALALPIGSFVTEENNKDVLAGRAQNQYSLVYDYQTKSYHGVLSSNLEATAQYATKPIPWLCVYSSEVSETTRSQASIIVNIYRSENRNIILKLTDPYNLERSFIFYIKYKSSAEVAFEINQSSGPFTAYGILSLDSISEEDLWIETENSFTEPLSYSLPTVTQLSEAAQLYDLSSDNGIMLRSSKFFSKYTADPTISIIPPAPGLDPSLDWTPRIKLGGFVYRDKAYYTGEYKNQVWSDFHGYPWIDAIGETATFLDRRTIKTKYTPIINSLNDLVILRKNSSIKHLVEDIDALRGLILMKEDIEYPEDIYITYSYKQTYYNLPLNLNPLQVSNNPEVGQYHVLRLRPYQKGLPSIIHTVEGVLPNVEENSTHLILMAFLITNKHIDNGRFNIIKPKKTGGGIKSEISLADIRTKVPDYYSLFDTGLLDGLRYPANSVMNITMPEFIRKGRTSVLLESYKADTYDGTLQIYGATNIAKDTLLTIYSGSGGSTAEQVSILGIVSHNRVRISKLLNNYSAGSIILLSKSRDGFFTEYEVQSIIKKFSTIGSYNFIEYK